MPILCSESGNSASPNLTFPTPDNQFCSPNDADCPGVHFSSAGATYDHKFLAAGTFHYFCEIHGGSGMTGTIVVIP